MTEESKKDDKPEGSGNKPNEGSKDKPVDKPGDKPGAAAVKPAESKPGDVGGAPPKPGPAAAAAKEPEKKTGPSVPASGAGARPGPSTPPPGAGAKANEGKRPPAAPPKKAKKSGCLSTVLWLVVVLVVIVVVGYYTWPQWSRYAEPYLPKAPALVEDHRVAELESRMAEVERKVSAPRPEIEAIRALQSDRQKTNEQLANAQTEVESLQKAIASLGKMTEPMKGADSGEAQKIVAGLTVRIDKLNQDLARAAEQGEKNTTELKQRIADLETKVKVANEGASEAAAVALAVGQLAEALKGSGPFSAELNAVKAFAKNDAEMTEAIAALEPRAAGGVPTVAELRGRFPAVARAVVQADTKLEEKSWVERAANRLSSLVTIRRTGERAVAAGGTDGALAGAEQALAANDLAAAIQAVETLELPAADAASGWLGDARARMTAERLLATLQTRAISLLAAKG